MRGRDIILLLFRLKYSNDCLIFISMSFVDDIKDRVSMTNYLPFNKSFRSVSRGFLC